MPEPGSPSRLALRPSSGEAPISDARLLTRIVIRNYRSIAACDVRLGALTFLVGPNGSGKSNFLDAFRFVADSLRSSLDHALRDRGGINEVRRRSTGHPTHFGIRLEFRLPGGAFGHYAFNVGARAHGAFVVLNEECFVHGDPTAARATEVFRVASGQVEETTLAPAPAAVKDRLFLVNAAGTPAFRPVYDALSGMGFYNLSPDRIRDLQPPDPGELLARDGSNLPSVLANLRQNDRATKARIEEYLAAVVPGMAGVDPKVIGPRETLEFRQAVSGSKHPWRFPAANMSDGTLRALGILIALFQGGTGTDVRSQLVGIEEPETALHPAAAEVLIDSLRDASRTRQVLVTSHSPELLDNPSISDEEILAVVSESGESKVGGLDAAGRTTLREHLFTAGELLRMNQLRPDPSAVALRPDQLSLFGEAA